MTVAGVCTYLRHAQNWIWAEASRLFVSLVSLMHLILCGCLTTDINLAVVAQHVGSWYLLASQLFGTRSDMSGVVWLCCLPRRNLNIAINAETLELARKDAHRLEPVHLDQLHRDNAQDHAARDVGSTRPL